MSAHENHPYNRRFDVVAPKTITSKDKTMWIQCGVAFENKKSGIINIKLDSVPVNIDQNGQLNLMLMEKEKE